MMDVQTRQALQNAVVGYLAHRGRPGNAVHGQAGHHYSDDCHTCRINVVNSPAFQAVLLNTMGADGYQFAGCGPAGESSFDGFGDGFGATGVDANCATYQGVQVCQPKTFPGSSGFTPASAASNPRLAAICWGSKGDICSQPGRYQKCVEQGFLPQGYCASAPPPITCPAGYEVDDTGTQCVPSVPVALTCPPGLVLNAVGTGCVPATPQQITCPTGYQVDPTGLQCVLIPAGGSGGTQPGGTTAPGGGQTSTTGGTASSTLNAITGWVSGNLTLIIIVGAVYWIFFKKHR